MRTEIKALSKDIADKIAAGEVVERPLSIVKELLENSIDSGADNITVEIQKGGKEYIRVSDNGCGIPKEELSLAFTRYATSKIAEEKDLNNILTLGFRGEALASIASVSETELVSRTEDSKIGAKIRIVAEETKYIEDTACEKGTTIVVRNLFFNIPARKKFLKPDNTEAALITDYVSKMALAYPSVKLRLISNGNVLFSTPGKGDLKQTILTVYSPKMAQSLIDIAFEDTENNYRIRGYISQPTESRTNRKWQIFFVNGRLIKSKLLETAISDAYHDKLFEGHYPLVFLFLDVDPSTLDVNIHPHKTEIRFYNEQNLSDFIIRSVRKALLKPESLDYHSNKHSAEKQEVAETVTEPSNEPVLTALIKQTTADSSYKENIFADLRYEEEIKETAVQEEITEYTEIKKEKTEKAFFTMLEYIGQAFDTYLICKDTENVYFIDQHAAHERVMYETLLGHFNKERNAVQSLITPIVIELTKAEMVSAKDAMPIAEDMGFEIREFGPASYAITGIPSCLSISEAEDFINSFFDAAEEFKSNIQLKKEEITSKSCKAAVKAHDRLNEAEIRKLFSDLDLCENPFSCPHGRPVFLRFSNYEIERMFKRK